MIYLGSPVYLRNLTEAIDAICVNVEIVAWNFYSRLFSDLQMYNNVSEQTLLTVFSIP